MTVPALLALLLQYHKILPNLYQHFGQITFSNGQDCARLYYGAVATLPCQSSIPVMTQQSARLVSKCVDL